MPGKSAKDAIMVGRSLVDMSKLRKEQLYMLCMDIKKAYNSVHWESLEKALTRLGFPESFRRLFKDIFERREMTVRTVYGYTKAFRPKRGLEQGDVILPLLWLCFFDPLLTAMNLSRKGFKCSEYKKIAHITFTDDSTICAGLLKDLKILVEIAEEFCRITDIEANVKKWVLASSTEKGRVEATMAPVIVDGKEINKIEGPKTAIRLLGGWLELGGSVVRSVEEIVKKARAVGEKLERKAIPILEVKYVMNNIMKPIISYGATGLGLRKSLEAIVKT